MTVRAGAPEGARGTTVHEPEGELVPILVDSLGEAVVARWTPGDGQQIWYVIPDGVDWNQVVDWLVQRALPEHVPAALRRVRSRHHVDPALEASARAHSAKPDHRDHRQPTNSQSRATVRVTRTGRIPQLAARASAEKADSHGIRG